MLNIKKRNLTKDVERRKFLRLKDPLSVKYKIVNEINESKSSRALHGITKNISINGICLETNTVQIDGMHISHDSSMLYKNIIEIDIDITSNTIIHARGSVCWYDLSRNKNKYQYDVGITFSEISEDDLDKLKTFLAQKAESLNK